MIDFINCWGMSFYSTLAAAGNTVLAVFKEHVELAWGSITAERNISCFYTGWLISCASSALCETSSCVMNQIRELIEVQTNIWRLDFFKWNSPTEFPVHLILINTREGSIMRWGKGWKLFSFCDYVSLYWMLWIYCLSIVIVQWVKWSQLSNCICVYKYVCAWVMFTVK